LRQEFALKNINTEVLPMKKYNSTKTVIAVSNKSAILVYLVTALMISTAAIYFIVASED
jgi:hypothetical protein